MVGWRTQEIQEEREAPLHIFQSPDASIAAAEPPEEGRQSQSFRYQLAVQWELSKRQQRAAKRNMQPREAAARWSKEPF